MSLCVSQPCCVLKAAFHSALPHPLLLHSFHPLFLNVPQMMVERGSSHIRLSLPSDAFAMSGWCFHSSLVPGAVRTSFSLFSFLLTALGKSASFQNEQEPQESVSTSSYTVNVLPFLNSGAQVRSVTSAEQKFGQIDVLDIYH